MNTTVPPASRSRRGPTAAAAAAQAERRWASPHSSIAHRSSACRCCLSGTRRAGRPTLRDLMAYSTESYVFDARCRPVRPAAGAPDLLAVELRGPDQPLPGGDLTLRLQGAIRRPASTCSAWASATASRHRDRAGQDRARPSGPGWPTDSSRRRPRRPSCYRPRLWSGVYLAKLTAVPGAVLRSVHRRDVAAATDRGCPDATWQAYNDFSGSNPTAGSTARERAFAVSFDDRSSARTARRVLASTSRSSSGSRISYTPTRRRPRPPPVPTSPPERKRAGLGGHGSTGRARCAITWKPAARTWPSWQRTGVLAGCLESSASGAQGGSSSATKCGLGRSPQWTRPRRRCSRGSAVEQAVDADGILEYGASSRHPSPVVAGHRHVRARSRCDPTNNCRGSSRTRSTPRRWTLTGCCLARLPHQRRTVARPSRGLWIAPTGSRVFDTRDLTFGADPRYAGALPHFPHRLMPPHGGSSRLGAEPTH